MSQPPYPPQGGNDPGGDQTDPQGWKPPAGAEPPDEQPTEQFGPPGGGPLAIHRFTKCLIYGRSNLDLLAQRFLLTA